ncbi:MAG: hypothetical protein ABIP39_09625 [Polyangiaceae bacterium]
MATKRKAAPIRVRSSALVRAEHGGAPVSLTVPEKSVLNEALRLGEDLREEIEHSITRYGRWILEAVFKDDVSSALDEKTKNPIWLELTRRAGGPTLRISRHVLYVALEIAALDRRVTQQSWRGLDSGRKEELLPLKHDASELRKAAQHVSSLNLTRVQAKGYVSEILREGGKARQVRVTSAQIVGRVSKLHALLDAASMRRRFGELRAGMKAEEREKVVGEIEKLREVLGEMVRVVRGRV